MQMLRPGTVEEAVAALAGGGLRALAGGTDLYPALGDRPAPALLDLTAIGALRGIAQGPGGWRIGATTTWSDVAEADLPPAFAGLKAAAREVGGVQIQNAGTVAGNLCNASPAADGVPPLLTLEASVEIAGPAGRRVLPLAAFVTGPRQTALAPGELVSAVLLPEPEAGSAGAFLKLGARRYLVISIAMVAGVLRLGADGRIAAARLAVGACAPVAQRLPALEAALAGCRPGAEAEAAIAAAPLDPLAPIDDVRAPAAYRLEAARRLIARTVAAAAEGCS
ncbi:MAG: FAD binding domain-containing protein [Pseudomonadota bacterium]